MAVPPVVLELGENMMGTICNFFREMWKITEMNAERCVSVLDCELDALHVVKRYLEMFKEHPMKTSEMV